MEQDFHQCKIGLDYQQLNVDLEETRKKASDIVWSFRSTSLVKIEGKRILA